MSETQRGPHGRRRYRMDFIPDKDLFAAVMFARKMIREGENPGKANYVAANYYGFSVEQVAHYTGQTAGTTAGRRRAGR